MGMFDYVRYLAPCKKCGTEINEWQSKDADCLLQTVELNQVTRFYGSCPACDEWHDKRNTKNGIKDA